MERNLYWLRWFRVLQNSFVFASFYVFFLRSVGCTALQVLLLTGVTAVSSAAGEVPTGYVADRAGRRASLLAGCVLACAGYVGYTVLTGFGMLAVGSAVVTGVGLSFVSGADSALAYESCPPVARASRHREFENWSNRYGGAAEACAGLAGAAELALGASLRAIMLEQAVTYALMIPIALRLREPARHLARSGSLRELGRIVAGVGRRPQLAALVLFSAVIGNLTFLFVWLTPTYYAAVRVGGAALPQSLFGVLWAAYLASMWVFGRFFRAFTGRLGDAGALVVVLVLGIASYAALGSAVWAGGLVIIFVHYFIRSMQLPLVTNMIIGLAGPGERATVASVRQLVQWTLYALTSAGVGVLIGRLGLGPAVLITGGYWAVLGVATLSWYLWARRAAPA